MDHTALTQIIQGAPPISRHLTEPHLEISFAKGGDATGFRDWDGEGDHHSVSQGSIVLWEMKERRA